MSKIVIRSAYSPREPVSVPLSGDPSPTKQEFIKEVDINEIVARMNRGIQPPAWMTSNTPHYGDFTNMPTSFQEAYAIVEEGEAAFKSLPLEFRRELDHNPANLATAPRELWERFGLLNSKNSAGASPDPDRDPGSPPKPNVQGDVDRPVKAPSGANKAAKKAASDADE